MINEFFNFSTYSVRFTVLEIYQQRLNFSTVRKQCKSHAARTGKAVGSKPRLVSQSKSACFQSARGYGMTLLLTSFPGPLRPLMLPSVTLIAFHPPRAINIETSGDETGPGHLSSVWRFHIHSLITNWRQYSNPVNNSSTKGAFHSKKISVRKFGNSTCPIERYIPIAQTRPAQLRVWLFVSRIQKLER